MKNSSNILKRLEEASRKENKSITEYLRTLSSKELEVIQQELSLMLTEEKERLQALLSKNKGLSKIFEYTSNEFTPASKILQSAVDEGEELKLGSNGLSDLQRRLQLRLLVIRKQFKELAPQFFDELELELDLFNVNALVEEEDAEMKKTSMFPQIWNLK